MAIGLQGLQQLRILKDEADGYWQLVAGNWWLAYWRLATGGWQLATGGWHLADDCKKLNLSQIKLNYI